MLFVELHCSLVFDTKRLKELLSVALMQLFQALMHQSTCCCVVKARAQGNAEPCRCCNLLQIPNCWACLPLQRQTSRALLQTPLRGLLAPAAPCSSNGINITFGCSKGSQNQKA